VPDSVTQDKVFFVFNNLSTANIDTKEKVHRFRAKRE
jgi:hypothetical protein